MSETREIPLTRGKVTVVDSEDFARLNLRRWYAKGKNGHDYAVRAMQTNHKKLTIRMANEILGIPSGSIVDHANGDALDNRKSNLRPATKQQNNRNARFALGISGFRGVTIDKHGVLWVAQIKCDGRRICLGRFADKISAALAYDAAAREYHGEFAVLNFKDYCEASPSPALCMKPGIPHESPAPLVHSRTLNIEIERHKPNGRTAYGRLTGRITSSLLHSTSMRRATRAQLRVASSRLCETPGAVRSLKSVPRREI